MNTSLAFYEKQSPFHAFSTNHWNKTYHNRLTRWVGRFLPFSFTIKHPTGKKHGFQQPSLKSFVWKCGTPIMPKNHEANYPTIIGKLYCRAIG